MIRKISSIKPRGFLKTPSPICNDEHIPANETANKNRVNFNFESEAIARLTCAYLYTGMEKIDGMIEFVQ